MLIKIHTRGFTLSDSLGEYTEAKIRLALGLYWDRIRRVDVFLADVNGPRGGEDMQCKIKVKIDEFSPVVVQETADEMYGAINICAQRIKRVCARRFDRLLRHRKAQHAAFARFPDMS